MKGDVLKRLMAEINGQLEQQNLKISNANVAVVDASIIESIGAPKRKAMDVEESGDVTPTPASKDKEAKWVKKAGRFYLGYKIHASSDEEGYLEGIHVTPANAHESRHLTPLLDDLPEGVELLADKGYASKANRAELTARGLKDGIMHKAVRGARSHQKSGSATLTLKRSAGLLNRLLALSSADSDLAKRSTLVRAKS